MFFRYSPASGLDMTEGLVFFGIALGAVFIARALARGASRFVIPPERVLFVGGGPVARVIARKLQLHPEYELDPIGYVDTYESAPDSSMSSLEYLGATGEIDQVCLQAGVERVLILSPEVSQSELADLIRRLRGPRCAGRDPSARRRRARPLGRGRRRGRDHRPRIGVSEADPLLAGSQAGRWMS